jgi:hypothetical protein
MINMFKRCKLNDRTQGYRYSWGLTRKRSLLKRYGRIVGKTMTGYHYGLRSLYIQHKTAKPLYNFGAKK